MTTFFDLMRNIVNTLNAVVRIDSQDLSEIEKAMARTNIDAVGQPELVEVKEQVTNMNADLEKVKKTPVQTTNDVEAGNTLPITSAGVYNTVGNIEVLLKTI